MSRSTPSDVGYAGSTRRPSEDSYRRPSEEGYRRRPSKDAYANRNDDSIYGGGGGGAGRRPSEDNFSISSRRKPSQDIVSNLRNGSDDRRRPSPDITLTGRRSGEDDRDLARRPSGSVSTTSDSTNVTNAQREVIIPNNSTIAEEEIVVPYARERESSSTAVDERMSRSPDTRSRSPDQRGLDTDGEGITDTDPSSARSPQLEVSGLGGLGGLGGLTARLRDRALDEDDEDCDGSALVVEVSDAEASYSVPFGQ